MFHLCPFFNVIPILCIIVIILCIVIPAVVSCINVCNSALGTRLLCGPLKALSRAAAPVGSVAGVTTLRTLPYWSTLVESDMYVREISSRHVC